MAEAEKKDKKHEKVERVKYDNIYAALSAFQGSLKPMPRSGRVTFETSGGKTVDFNYTPLGEIMQAIYPLLAETGLSIRHEITEKGIEAVLTHETYKGSKPIFMAESSKVEVPEGTVLLKGATPVQKFDVAAENEIRSGIVKMGQTSQMKDTGAAITYARRYTLTMVLGISSEEDKDAELLEQSGKNAISFVFDKTKKGLTDAKDIIALDKATAVLKKDLENLEKGKAPALGMSKEQYEALLTFADTRKKVMEENAGAGNMPMK